MNRQITVNDILSYLPVGTTYKNSSLKLDTDFLKSKNIVYEYSASEFYVEPDFEEAASQSNAGKFCCLVSAPAAVGKTTFAKNLLRRLSTDQRTVLHIPLRNEKIGGNYFSGLIGNIFPASPKTDILRAIVDGTVVLLFDGYDEVSMTNQQIELNRLFVEEILREISGAGETKGIGIFFLFRSVFFEFGIFEALIPRSRLVRLQFFSEQKRREFLVKYLEHTYGRRNTDSIASKLLGGFSNKLGVANTEAAAFFGHAIVLEAFGDYIFQQPEDNLQVVANNLAEKNFEASHSVGILSNIIGTILEREVGKFSTSEFDKASDAFVPFDAESQEVLLETLAHCLATRNDEEVSLQKEVGTIVQKKIANDTNLALLQPVERDELSRSYFDELVRKFDHHPFISLDRDGRRAFRNPVYFEYYLAKYAAKKKEGNVAEVLGEYKSPSYFFAMFFLNFLKDRNVAGFGDAIYYICNTYLSSSGVDNKSIRIDCQSGDSGWNISLDESLRIESFRYQDEILQLGVPSGRILGNFDIEGPGRLVIINCGTSESFDTFAALSDGAIKCETLSVVGDKIRFDQLNLDCDEVEIGESVSRLQGCGSVAISNPYCKLHMSDHLKRLHAAEFDITSNDPTVSDTRLLQKVKRIVLYFRKHGREDFGCYSVKFGSRVLNKGNDSLAVRLSNYFHDIGLIKEREGLKVLDQSALRRLGISYVKQNEIDITSEGLLEIKRAIEA